MNGIHDMGGMDGFGPARPEVAVEPPPTGGSGAWNGIHDMGGMDGFGPARPEVAVEPPPTGGSGA